MQPSSSSSANAETGAKKAEIDPVKRKPYDNISRELEASELDNPAVKKLLLDHIDRLEEEVRELSGYRKEYHQADKDRAILRNSASESKKSDIMLSVGWAALGFIPAAWSVSSQVTIAFAVVGLALVGAVVYMRFFESTGGAK